MADSLLYQIETRLDHFSEATGRIVAWATLGLVLVSFSIVIARSFKLNTALFDDVALYLHSTAFMCGIAYTLKHDAHVRIDIFYQKFSTYTQAWVTLLGTLVLLLPLCAFVFLNSFEYVVKSWEIVEGSRNTGGLPLLFVLKSLLLLMPILLALQGVAVVLRSVRVLSGKEQTLQPEHDTQEL